MASRAGLTTLYRQAIGLGLARDCESGRIEFYALAQRAASVGRRPGALFAWLIRRPNRAAYITQAQEDRAVTMLKRARAGPPRSSRSRPDTAPRRGDHDPRLLLTDDARMAAAFERIAREHRIDDPWTIARMRGWSPERWRLATLARLRAESGMHTTADEEAEHDQE